MPDFIEQPSWSTTVGNKPKLIDEYIGQVFPILYMGMMRLTLGILCL